MVDGGKRVSEGRYAAKPSIKACSRQEFPTRIFSAGRLSGLVCTVQYGELSAQGCSA